MNMKELEERQNAQDDSIAALTNTVAAISDNQSAQDGKLDNILNMLMAQQAPHAYARTPRGLDAAEHQDPNEYGMARDGIDEIEIVTHDVDSPWTQQHVDELRFNEDMLTIEILESSEKNADQIFEVGVNGRMMVFQRGHQYTVPRKFVENLARAKPVTYRNEEYVAADGTRSVRWPTHRGLRYPFQVISDPHPRGKDWLKSILSQPN